MIQRSEHDRVAPPPEVRGAALLDGLRRGTERVLWVVRPTRENQRVVLGWSLDRASAAWYETRAVFGGATFAAVALASLIAYILSRSVTRPLESVTVSLDQLTRQPRWDLRTRVAVRTRDEIGDLAVCVNRFIAELAQVVAATRASAEQVVRRTDELSASTEQMSASGRATDDDRRARRGRRGRAGAWRRRRRERRRSPRVARRRPC